MVAISCGDTPSSSWRMNTVRFFSASWSRSLANTRTRARRSASSSGRRPLLVGRVLGGELLGVGRTTARRATMHEHHVDRDAVNPGAELGLVAEVLQASKHLDEDFLHHVVDVCRSIEHPVDEAGDVVPMALIERSEGCRVCLCRAADEVSLIGHGWCGDTSEGDGRSGTHFWIRCRLGLRHSGQNSVRKSTFSAFFCLEKVVHCAQNAALRGPGDGSTPEGSAHRPRSHSAAAPRLALLFRAGFRAVRSLRTPPIAFDHASWSSAWSVSSA